MRILTWAGCVVLVTALGVAAGVTHCRATAIPSPVPCNTSAMASAFHGDLALDGFNAVGCVGDYAYAWATVGKGVEEIGVTEVLKYDHGANTWRLVSRLTYCGHHRLPYYVERWGCNSN